MKDATLNIRLDATLKQHGMAVLDKEGVSVTEAVRALFEYMETNQALPDFLQRECGEERAFERRRELMRSMVGIIPLDLTLEEAREARYARHGL